MKNNNLCSPLWITSASVFPSPHPSSDKLSRLNFSLRGKVRTTEDLKTIFNSFAISTQLINFISRTNLANHSNSGGNELSSPLHFFSSPLGPQSLELSHKIADAVDTEERATMLWYHHFLLFPHLLVELFSQITQQRLFRSCRSSSKRVYSLAPFFWGR